MSQTSRDGGDIFPLDLLLGSLSAVGIVFTLKVGGQWRLIGNAVSVVHESVGVGRGSRSRQGDQGCSSPSRELCPPPTFLSGPEQSAVITHQDQCSAPAFSPELNVALSGKLSLPRAQTHYIRTMPFPTAGRVGGCPSNSERNNSPLVSQ